MFPIASQTVGSGGASSITFSSIPQNFTHLQLRVFTHTTGAAGTNMPIQFNGDTGGNYVVHYLGGSGSSAFSGTFGTNGGFGDIGWTAGSTETNVFGASLVDILDYTNVNKYKTLKSINGIDSNGAGLLGLWSSLWMSTAAITQINISPSAGNFSQYSTFQLYGIQTSNATGA
jgi:hypothetical protein